MPIYTLQFNIPEEQEEFNDAIKGTEYKIILHELQEFIRQKLKYEELSEGESKAYENLRNFINELKETS